MTWLQENPWLAWLGLALVLAAVEAATVDFTFLMISGGALAGGVAAAAGAPFPAQVVVAVAVAALMLFLVRPIIKRRFMDTETAHGIGAPSLVGRAAIVVATVTEHDGRVKLAGDTWSARVPVGGRLCEPGQEVRVVAIEGATAIVTGVGTPETTP
jgi:membrane protein implicated in regulation of membrane protease activity